MNGRTWQLELPYERPPLTLNSRMHHMKAYREAEQIKNDVGWLAKAKKLPSDRSVRRVRIELYWEPGSRRRRDEDNPQPTLKHCIDGLVRHGLVPDDNVDVVASGVTILPAVRGRGRTWLQITELPVPASK